MVSRVMCQFWVDWRDHFWQLLVTIGSGDLDAIIINLQIAWHTANVFHALGAFLKERLPCYNENNLCFVISYQDKAAGIIQHVFGWLIFHVCILHWWQKIWIINIKTKLGFYCFTNIHLTISHSMCIHTIIIRI